MFVKTVEPTDNTVKKIVILLDQEDVLVDGVNIHFKESIEKANKVEEHGMHYIGMSVSGGEEGAHVVRNLRKMPKFIILCDINSNYLWTKLQMTLSNGRKVN